MDPCVSAAPHPPLQHPFTFTLSCHLGKTHSSPSFLMVNGSRDLPVFAQTLSNGVSPVGKTPFCRLPCGENAFTVQKHR